MKKLPYIILFLLSYVSISQPNNYYESCIGLEGEDLKSELHNIIKDHTAYSYTITKSILREADEDPNNPSNIILVYSGNSIDKFDFSSSFEPDFWNREHVWPKSHGDFDAGDPFEVPLYTDAHNLKPVDASMNTLRGEKDFQTGGEIVYNGEVATSCYSTSSTFEPRDAVKGDIARIILYMDVRYEGGSNANEPNLVPIDGLTTYPNPQIGVLSTLLEWHQQDPPDDFEKRRNDVIYDWQGNRNPFIDYPNFVDIIYNDASANAIQISNVQLPQPLEGGTAFNISADIISMMNCGPIESVTINYGNSWNLEQVSEMIFQDNSWTVDIDAQSYNTMFCYSIMATDCDGNSNSFYGSEVIAPYPFEGLITTISEIQGQQEFSPYEGQTVNTTGIVTGAFANSFYIQDGDEPWSGIYIYSGDELPVMGDSVIVTGEISEFCWNGSPCACSTCGGAGVTELYQPDEIYIISNNNPLPEPILVSSGDALSEQYEGVLIRMEDVECLSLPSGFGVWQVDDGTGSCGIHNTPDGYEFDPQISAVYNITGIVTSTFDEWKVDLRMPSDVESGQDILAPFIIAHNCQDGNNSYVITLTFNEAIDPDFLNASNFFVSNASIQNISPGFIDPTQVILTLDNVISNNIGIIINEIMDLSDNMATNISYNIECDFNISINELDREYNIFPNPNNGSFILDLHQEINKIAIYDSKGQIILSKELHNGEHSIHIEKAGFYYLELNNNLHQKIIIN